VGEPHVTDAVRTRIGQAIMLHRGGDREEARNRLALLWSQTADGGDLFERCTIAHYMADTREDPDEELEWDRRALAAADAIAGDEASWEKHALAVRSLYPSLYLSLAADYARLGEGGAARRELARAREAAGALAQDAYGLRIRSAIERLATSLGAA
jgi:hypothetical protein